MYLYDCDVDLTSESSFTDMHGCVHSQNPQRKKDRLRFDQPASSAICTRALEAVGRTSHDCRRATTNKSLLTSLREVELLREGGAVQ